MISFNAKSLSKLGALITNEGELDGVRLLKEETIEKSMKVMKPEYDFGLVKTFSRTYGGFGYLIWNSINYYYRY